MSTRPENVQCQNCCYCRKIDATSGSFWRGSTTAVAQCHLNPRLVQYGDDSPDLAYQFPRIDLGDFCVEFSETWSKRPRLKTEEERKLDEHYAETREVFRKGEVT